MSYVLAGFADRPSPCGLASLGPARGGDYARSNDLLKPTEPVRSRYMLDTVA